MLQAVIRLCRVQLPLFVRDGALLTILLAVMSASHCEHGTGAAGRLEANEEKTPRLPVARACYHQSYHFRTTCSLLFWHKTLTTL